MICVDTNILIYAHRAGTDEHPAAQAVIERAAASRRGWGISLPSIGEFWAQVTHPRFPGGPSTVAEAAGFLDGLLGAGQARVFTPGPDFPERLIDAVRELEIRGPRVFDVQIGLMARAAGATQLWTHDASFVPVAGLRIADPLA